MKAVKAAGRATKRLSKQTNPYAVTRAAHIRHGGGRIFSRAFVTGTPVLASTDAPSCQLTVAQEPRASHFLSFPARQNLISNPQRALRLDALRPALASASEG